MKESVMMTCYLRDGNYLALATLTAGSATADVDAVFIDDSCAMALPTI